MRRAEEEEKNKIKIFPFLIYKSIKGRPKDQRRWNLSSFYRWSHFPMKSLFNSCLFPKQRLQDRDYMNSPFNICLFSKAIIELQARDYMDSPFNLCLFLQGKSIELQARDYKS